VLANVFLQHVQNSLVFLHLPFPNIFLIERLDLRGIFGPSDDLDVVSLILPKGELARADLLILLDVAH